jgi:2-oxoisovalerate dehydrogenase E1 component alpha subunit
VYYAVRVAVERARRGGGPTLNEARVVRLPAHTSNDDERRYRTDEEREAARVRDPVLRFKTALHQRGTLDDTRDTILREGVDADVRAARAAAEVAPGPLLETATDHVFAGGREVNPLLRWRG